MRKILFSNFQNNEYDIMIERDVIFHVTSGAIDVIKVGRQVMVTFHLNLRFVTTLQTGITDRIKNVHF